jgi:hypothetical protein
MQHHACHYDFRSPTSHKPADDPITLIDDATKNIIRLVRLQDNIRLSLVKGTVSMRNVVAYYCEQKQVLHTRYRVGQVMKPRSPENLYSHTHTHIEGIMLQVSLTKHGYHQLDIDINPYAS